MARDHYAMGTYIDTAGAWQVNVGGRALCTDGKVRTLCRIAQTADTFFSVPAAVRVKGKTVTGFITVQTVQGYDTPSDDDPAVVKFHAYTYRKNGHLLP